MRDSFIRVFSDVQIRDGGARVIAILECIVTIRASTIAVFSVIGALSQ